MTLRDCARIYGCGNGTDDSCRKALCPFYEKRIQPKPKRETLQPKKKSKVKEGWWDWSDPSGFPRYRED